MRRHVEDDGERWLGATRNIRTFERPLLFELGTAEAMLLLPNDGAPPPEECSTTGTAPPERELAELEQAAALKKMEFDRNLALKKLESEQMTRDAQVKDLESEQKKRVATLNDME